MIRLAFLFFAFTSFARLNADLYNVAKQVEVALRKAADYVPFASQSASSASDEDKGDSENLYQALKRSDWKRAGEIIKKTPGALTRPFTKSDVGLDAKHLGMTPIEYIIDLLERPSSMRNIADIFGLSTLAWVSITMLTFFLEQDSNFFYYNLALSVIFSTGNVAARLGEFLVRKTGYFDDDMLEKVVDNIIETINKIENLETKDGKELVFSHFKPIMSLILSLAKTTDEKTGKKIKLLLETIITQVDNKKLTLIIEHKSKGYNPLLESLSQLSKATKRRKIVIFAEIAEKILEKVTEVGSIAPLIDVLGFFGKTQKGESDKRVALKKIAKKILDKTKPTSSSAPLIYALIELSRADDKDEEKIDTLKHFIERVIREKIEGPRSNQFLVDTLYPLAKVGKESNRGQALLSIAQTIISKKFFSKEKVNKVLSQFIKDDSLRNTLLNEELHKVGTRGLLSSVIKRLRIALANIAKGLTGSN